MAWPLHLLEASDLSMPCSVSQGGPAGPSYISPGAVALASAVVAVNGMLSLWLKLDMHWQLLIGAVRWHPGAVPPSTLLRLCMCNIDMLRSLATHPRFRSPRTMVPSMHSMPLLPGFPCAWLQQPMLTVSANAPR